MPVSKSAPDMQPGDLWFEIESIEIVEWSPDPVPYHSPCTEVHMIITIKGVDQSHAHMVMRIKSLRMLNEIVQALREHGLAVFAGPPKA